MTQQITQQRLKTSQANDVEPVLIASTPLEESDVQDWLAQEVSEQLGIAAADVDICVPFNSYGLASAQAMAIAAAGRQRFGLEISPLVIWNHPTIAALSRYISEALNNDDIESFEI
ncbi:MAG: acyl carrier protein [Cyanobacteria bacterium J06598_3]